MDDVTLITRENFKHQLEKLGEQARVFKSTADSIGSGVAVIHQELHRVPEMTVAWGVCRPVSA